MTLPEKPLAWGMARSCIRELAEYGWARKAEIGADKVYDFSIGNRFSSRGLVGLNQSTCTKFDAAKISNDKNQHIRQIVRVDLSKNRFPSRTRRFSIVVCPKDISFWSQHICVTEMSSVIIFFLIFSNNCLNLINIINRKSECKKLASLFRIYTLGRSFNCQIVIQKQKDIIKTIYGLPIQNVVSARTMSLSVA